MRTEHNQVGSHGCGTLMRVEALALKLWQALRTDLVNSGGPHLSSRKETAQQPTTPQSFRSSYAGAAANLQMLLAAGVYSP